MIVEAIHRAEGVKAVLRRLYDWTLSLAASPHALVARASVGLIERRLGLMFTVFIPALVGGFGALRPL